MTMIRIALAKAHALPSTIEERRAKIRKASLATQKKSRDSPCSLSSFCVPFAIIFYLAARKLEAAHIRAGQESKGSHIGRPAINRPPNDGKSKRVRTQPRARSRPLSSGSRGRIARYRPENCGRDAAYH